MNTYEAVLGRRSIRRFTSKKVEREILKRCVNAGRLSPTGANLQPLKFITVTKDLKAVFRCTNWAGYLEWEPSEDEMPRAYIAILKEKDKGSDIDVGAAVQSICLTAHEEGLGSCLLGAIDRDALKDILPIPEGYGLKLLVALGYPDEVSETVEDSDSVEYYRDGEVLKVPKKPLEEVWIEV